ncbi:MAG: DUF4339 domain-containing protein [Pirellulales bacterium]
MAKWFYVVDGHESGPVEPADLKRLAASGQLKPTDKVRREDMAEWFHAKQVKDLFAAAARLPAGGVCRTTIAAAPPPTAGLSRQKATTNGTNSGRQQVSHPSGANKSEQLGSRPVVVSSNEAFGSWYRGRLGQHPLVLQIICWLFYGYFWIPIWWLVTRHGPPSMSNRVLTYAVVTVLAMAFLSTITLSITSTTESSSRISGSDQRNCDLLIAGIAVLGGNKAVETVSVNGNSATITVTIGWHYSPYQVRLQAAQNIWRLWSNIAPTNNPDEARISFVDYNGNEVGSSRVWGGSLIWVQEE